MSLWKMMINDKKKSENGNGVLGKWEAILNRMGEKEMATHSSIIA